MRKFGAYLGPKTSVSSASGTGIWDLNDQEYHKRLNNWPISPSIELSIQNGSSCPTIVDSSPNNLTITNLGSVTCSESLGALFSGSNSLRINNNQAFNLIGSIPYTIEFWMNMTSYSNNYTTIITRRTSNNWQWLIGFSDPSSRRLYFSGTSTGSTSINSTSQISLNTWTYVAVSVSNGQAYLFIDGLLAASGARPNQSDNGANLFIGQQSSNGEYYSGYLDNIMIRKNFAYTSNFTPPNR